MANLDFVLSLSVCCIRLHSYDSTAETNARYSDPDWPISEARPIGSAAKLRRHEQSLGKSIPAFRPHNRVDYRKSSPKGRMVRPSALADGRTTDHY